MAVFWLAMTAVCWAQQGGTTRYVYDDNNRLRAVISPTGEAAVYEYDPAGNFTAIRRLAADTLEVLDFSPKAGVPGDKITIIGVGFNTTGTAVSFNGIAATNAQVSAPTIIAEVPPGATTGPITVTNARGTVMTARPFFVEGVVIRPSQSTVLAEQQVQFSADVMASGNSSVKWSVSGIQGGNISVGTITETGIYTAPALGANQSTTNFTVRATSIIKPTVFGEARVTVQNPAFFRALYASAVAVNYGSNGAVYSPFVSVVRGLTSIKVSESGAVSVLYGANAMVYSPLVTVERISPIVKLSQTSGAVSVLYGGNVTVASPNVAVSTGPWISSLTPQKLSKGATQTVTIQGIGLSGVNKILFLDSNGEVRSELTTSNLQVSADGNSLTVTVTVGSSLALGRYTVVVSSPDRHSPVADQNTNTIEVIP